MAQVVIQVNNVEDEKTLGKHDRFYLERILFKNVMNIFHQAAPDKDISDKTGEGAVEDAPYTCGQHGCGLEVTRLQLNTYNIRKLSKPYMSLGQFR